MSTVRLRRLQADYEKLSDFARRHPRLRLISAEGQPPELYQLEYQIVGLRQIDDQLQVVKNHVVEIRLPRDYPRTPPQCRMLTPIFHPNIAPHAICIGDHWSAGEPLWSMVARIGEMIAYQSYNTKSPLNGEAARWVEQNVARLPLDRVSMQIDEPAAKPVAARAPTRGGGSSTATPTGPAQPAAKPSPRPAAAAPSATPAAIPAAIPAAAPAAAPTVQIAMVCPGCGHRYKVSAAHIGKRARCSHCQQVIVVTASAERP